MEFGHNTLEQWFLALPEKYGNKNRYKDFFPYKKDYVKQYAHLSETLYETVHKNVQAGNMLSDEGFLTDHGPEHIRKVIFHATNLLKSKEILFKESKSKDSPDSYQSLTPYEIYILLMAIHVHDIANILGRKDHEINSKQVMELVANINNEYVYDEFEWDVIFEIAEAHGGHPKDKISYLQDDSLLGFPINKKILASTLKLADELADDRERANRYLLLSNKIPQESIIYHDYAFSLTDVTISHESKSISLSFILKEDQIHEEYLKIKKSKSGSKLKRKIKILDEVYERTLKTHNERLYCMRFLKPGITLEQVRVFIKIKHNEKKSGSSSKIESSIQYDISEIGYPGNESSNLMDMIPILKEYTGIEVSKKLEKGERLNVRCD